MRDKLLLILIIFCLCFVLPLHAQENNIAEMTPEYYSSLKLPPLDSLFENAKMDLTFKFWISINKEKSFN